MICKIVNENPDLRSGELFVALMIHTNETILDSVIFEYDVLQT